MAITGHVYGQFINALATKTVNLSSDTLKVMLVSASYTPNQASDTHASTPAAFEVTGTGYAAGGVALTSVVLSDSANTFTLAAANATWTTASFNARYAVIYDSQPGSYASDPLIGYVDFGVSQAPVAVDFVIQWNLGNILQITVA